MGETPENLLIPAEFYFHPTFEIPFRANLQQEIAAGEVSLGLAELPELRFLPGSSGAASHAPRVSLAWNDQGIAVEILFDDANPLRSKGKSNERGSANLYIDTRDLKSNRRHSRFCQLFVLDPSPGNKGKYGLERVELSPDPRKQAVNLKDCLLIAQSANEQSRLVCWLDASAMTGFDPENVPSLGFYYFITDPEIGEFAWGDFNFPYASDPSLWGSLKLIR